MGGASGAVYVAGRMQSVVMRDLGSGKSGGMPGAPRSMRAAPPTYEGATSGYGPRKRSPLRWIMWSGSEAIQTSVSQAIC